MTKSLILIILCFFVCVASFAQKQDRYEELTNNALELYKNRDYLQAGIKYNEAFFSNGNRGLIDDRYIAACSWALVNRVDSAFVQLFRIAKSGYYSDYDHIIIDKELSSLHSEKRWNELVEIIKSNKEKIEAKYDQPLKAILDTVFTDDQKYRIPIDEIIKRYGSKSKEMEMQNRIIIKADSINLLKVKKILDERGWLGEDVVGKKGNMALFLVIQHSELKTQEKYLPMLREAVKKHNAYPPSLALLEDRVLIGQGKMQIYGSQIIQDTGSGKYYILPLEDPENVDKRREEVGLDKLQNYVSQWGIMWDIEEYKTQLPKIEAIKNK